MQLFNCPIGGLNALQPSLCQLAFINLDVSHTDMKLVQQSSRTKRRMAKRIEDAIPWIGALLALAAALVLDSPKQQHRWHSAIMWTVCTFTFIVLFGRPRWTSIGFWWLCTAAFVAHLIAMWALFGTVPAMSVVGIILAPIALVEGVLILGLIGTLMGWSTGSSKHRPTQ